MKSSEKRREPRHIGKLPIFLESGQGITRDFNVSGMYFETDRPFSAGQSIEFSIVLKHSDTDHPLRLKCLGEIVRVEEIGHKIGVGASIHSYSFEELKDSEKRQDDSK